MCTLLSLKEKWVKLPDLRVPSEIWDDPKRRDFFGDCIGALDGSHILIKVNQEMQTRCRNHKGTISQNVLAACNFDLTFSYVLAGWEGSAHDGRVLRDARSKDFLIPDGKYYLGDAGYGLSNKVLTPYRGTRYHVREQILAAVAPASKEELFNLRHAQLRNAIERIFGVLKARFAIVRSTSGYDYDMVTCIINAAVILHNFIRQEGDDEYDLNPWVDDNADPVDEEEIYDTADSMHEGTAGGPAWRKRDGIARAMWYQYQCYINTSR